MEEHRRKAYAKINLGLDVIRRRSDGYHDVKMILQNIGLYDELIFRKSSRPEITLDINGFPIPEGEGNLVYQAAALLRKEYRIRQGVHISLDKRIPVAAGMAGGSTDAAAVFHGLNELFSLGCSGEELCRLGVGIGADVPFCIIGGTALAQGIGEKLKPLAPPPECSVVIAKPDAQVSTRFVYENLKLDASLIHPDIDGILEGITEGNYRKITGNLGNILESVTVKEYPVIAEIKEFFLHEGADASLMSGSGPTVFALFEKKESAQAAAGKLKETNLAKDIYVTAFL